MASCGPFRRTSSELQDPSNYTRLMVDNDNHDKASASAIVVGSKAISQGQKNSSSLPKDVVVGSSLPKKDVVNEEKKSTYVDNNNVYQQEEKEEIERISDYDGPMFMKSPSFRDFVRPIDRLDSVRNGGKKEEKPKENKEIEAPGPNYVCTGEVCTRAENKNETPVENKEADPGKEKRVYKVFSQYYGGGVKSLFHHHHPKQPKHSD